MKMGCWAELEGHTPSCFQPVFSASSGYDERETPGFTTPKHTNGVTQCKLLPMHLGYFHVC